MGLLSRLFGPPGPDRFAELMMRAIRETGEERPMSYDAAAFHLVLPNGFMLSLHNAYQEYCSVPRGERQDVLRRYAAFARTVRQDEKPKPLAEVQGDLLPRIRDRFYWEAVRLQSQLQDGKPVDPKYLPHHKPLNGHLSVDLVVDEVESVRSVTEPELQEWGLSFDQALGIARENLWKRSNQSFDEVRPGLYVSPWADSHDASRLYLHDLIWQLKVKGDHVAAVPNRDVLIVTGADDADGLLKMAAMTEQALGLPRPMTGVPMRLQGKVWVPLELEPSHRAYWAMRKLQIVTEANEYANQKQLLDTIHEKAGRDIFVASYTAVQKKDSRECLSYCTWTEGADSLLPRTSHIMFMAGEGASFAARVTWEQAQRVVGDLMEPQGMCPERYRVQRFPNAAQIRQLKALTTQA